MPLLYLSRNDVYELLPIGECIEVMAGVLAALARGETLQPLRSVLRLRLGEQRRGLLGLMPGQIPVAPSAAPPAAAAPPPSTASSPPDVAGIKVITLYPDNRARGLESHQGAVLLFDTDTGSPIAYFDAASLTAVRTAAVSGLATRLLARADAGDLALLGAGVQAAAHLEAMSAVRRLRRARVWSRRPESARRFAAEAAGRHARHAVSVEPAATAREAVAGADLICTTTASPEPVLAGDWIAPGAHLNAVGACVASARELDGAAVARSRLFVDRRESALNESGDFLLALREGAIGEEHIQGELGDLLLGRHPGRRDPSEVTLFKSLGLAVEDLAAAHHAYRKALAAGRGIVLEP